MHVSSPGRMEARICTQATSLCHPLASPRKNCTSLNVCWTIWRMLLTLHMRLALITGFSQRTILHSHGRIVLQASIIGCGRSRKSSRWLIAAGMAGCGYIRWPAFSTRMICAARLPSVFCFQTKMPLPFAIGSLIVCSATRTPQDRGIDALTTESIGIEQVVSSVRDLPQPLKLRCDLPLLRLPIIFLFSGASSLIFETIFTHLLTYTFGNTAHAATTVLGLRGYCTAA